MTTEKDQLIIFNEKGEPMGEMIFNHDLFLQATLYPTGEESLGGCLEDWQVNGVLYFHPEADSNTSISTRAEYVTMHDPTFPTALRQWLESNSLYSVLLPEDSWDIWSYIEHLPLTNREKFTLIMRASLSEKQDLVKYKKSIQKLLTEMEKSQVKPKVSEKTIKKVSKNTVKTAPKKTISKKVKVKIKK